MKEWWEYSLAIKEVTEEDQIEKDFWIEQKINEEREEND